jgi:hypothetical protein
MAWIKKYWKNLMFLVLLLFIVTAAVLGWHWEETANRPFWFEFWPVAAAGCLLLWAGAWFYFWSRDKRR